MAERLKDRFFQKAFLNSLVAEITRVHARFEGKRFLRLVHDEDWGDRELKARMRHVSEALGQTLPGEYRKALRILSKVEKHFTGFDHLLFADFVERFGVEDFEASIPALETFTRSSAEFAIRPFIRRYPKKAMAQMKRWARSPRTHVRRLASEGCRPRLPWGAGLPELKRDPAPILPVLELLKDDASEDVRRSVANNLNDISKDHPDLALEIGERWLGRSGRRAPLVKHGLRGLLKKGNPRAIALFGLEQDSEVRVARLSVTPRRIPLGGVGQLRAELVSEGRRAQPVRLEYEVRYARPRGKTSLKVFQLRQMELRPGQQLELRRKLNFSDRSTRKHHPGKHSVTLVVNGVRMRSVSFTLFAEPAE